MDVDDPALRKGATGRLAHGFELARELRADMEAWWSVNPVALEIELRDDERTIDWVLNTDPLPDLDDWYHRANDIVQSYRTALNRFTKAVCFNFSVPGDGNFPTHDSQVGWEQWLKKHPGLPADIAQRFYAFEPFVSGRPHLRALRDATNDEKHDLGFSTAVTMTEFEMGGWMRVEGLWHNDGLGEQLQLVAGQTLDITATRQVIGSAVMPTRIIDFLSDGIQPKSTFAFRPTIRSGGEDIPLFAATEEFGLEAAWAIGHVAGVVTDSRHRPEHLNI